MPPADRSDLQKQLLRQLLYGLAKARKTWWALRCAELGYNVLLLDGDDGSHIIKQLPASALPRISVVDLTATNDESVFATFMGRLLKKNNRFIWDEQAKREIMGVFNPKHSHYVFDAAKFNENDVIILDSWTALASSVAFKFADESNIDLSESPKTEWTGYGFNARFLDWVLDRLHTLPCHVIVIAHATVYEKWDRRDPNPKNHRLLESATVPISSSGPHGKKLAKHFSDVLYFERVSATASTINAGGDFDRDGGSRLVAPRKYSWDELSPKVFFDAIHSKPTGAPCAGAVWSEPGKNCAPATTEQTQEVATATPAQQAPATVLKQGGGMSSLKLQLGGKR